ncbi:hypothetical protein [Aerosakkonema funiforme]|uniref:hypothetical protein n=1 Tax=Aerosakkonema funiforme TaxID=1246630 RepID=UPI0035B76C2F
MSNNYWFNDLFGDLLDSQNFTNQEQDNHCDNNTDNGNLQNHESNSTHSELSHDGSNYHLDQYQDLNYYVNDWHAHPSEFDPHHSRILGDIVDQTNYWNNQHFKLHHHSNAIVGDPAHEMQYWHHQIHSEDCAIATQEFVLESLTGQHFSENKLCLEAMNQGWYIPGIGTPADYVGDLIAKHGFPVAHEYGCTIEHLAEKLDNHEKVIVGVNESVLLISNQSLNNYLGIPSQRANHAVQVIGIDNSHPDRPMVILNDPGVADGKGMMVSLKQFEKAWAASDHMMVSTCITNNHELHHSVNFATLQAHEQNALSLNSDHSILGSSDCLSVHIWNDGDVWLYRNGNHVSNLGHVNGRTIYNSAGHEAGYAGTDGKIYDRNDKCVGRVDACGHVYNTADEEVYTTNNGVVGGAAYLLLVYLGGMK